MTLKWLKNRMPKYDSVEQNNAENTHGYDRRKKKKTPVVEIHFRLSTNT